MYYAIGVSAPSLHRESTDSLIHVHVQCICNVLNSKCHCDCGELS